MGSNAPGAFLVYFYTIAGNYPQGPMYLYICKIQHLFHLKQFQFAESWVQGENKDHWVTASVLVV